MRKIRLISLCLLLALIAPAAFPQSNQAPPAKSTSAHAPSPAEIATAKAAHQVWVNLGTGIYHKSGRWYGKTQNGTFMSESDAKKAGYKASKRG